MNTSQDNYLWDPTADVDPEVARLEQMLEPCSAQALGLISRELSLGQVTSSRRSRSRRWSIAVLGVAAAFAVVAILHFYRLSWPENAPWPLTIAHGGGVERPALWQVGESVTTADNETAIVSAARIGTVRIASRSSVALIKSGNQRHRLDLKYGRLHAKIWAPPGYFGVANGDALALDLGCEFEMEADRSGQGALTVAGGWVIYNHRGIEVLVPQDHRIRFSADMIGTPVRNDADAKFRDLVHQLDLLFLTASDDNTQRDSLIARIAAMARDADQVTLLSLLTRYRELSNSPLYDRLRVVLGDPGDHDAINEWWGRLPAQPKRWWVNWRDAFAE
jgi:hypothetical protein